MFDVRVVTDKDVFVPFLGDFLSILRKLIIKANYADGFRPLSWGLSFNVKWEISFHLLNSSFRPLSWGLSFNENGVAYYKASVVSFRPLSWGLSFNMKKVYLVTFYYVFVPFLGDFLSIS